MTMAKDELMEFLGIDPIKDAETRDRVAEWTPESPNNPEELGHYYQVR